MIQRKHYHNNNLLHSCFVYNYFLVTNLDNHRKHIASCAEKILGGMTNFLYDIGEISGKSIFIDCTKIEAYANEYTFFGKKAVTKNMGKLLNKIADLVQECEELYGIKLIYKNIVQMKHIKRLRMNISIQAEGSFAQVKQDMNFMCLGQKNY